MVFCVTFPPKNLQLEMLGIGYEKSFPSYSLPIRTWNIWILLPTLYVPELGRGTEKSELPFSPRLTPLLNIQHSFWESCSQSAATYEEKPGSGKDFLDALQGAVKGGWGNAKPK